MKWPPSGIFDSCISAQPAGEVHWHNECDTAEQWRKELDQLLSHNEMNKIAQSKRSFKDQHYALIDTPEFRRILNAFGYEW